MSHESRNSPPPNLQIINADSTRDATLVHAEPTETTPEAQRAAAIQSHSGPHSASPRSEPPTVAIHVPVDLRIQTTLVAELAPAAREAIRGRTPRGNEPRAEARVGVEWRVVTTEGATK
jgi:hypothetical protein